MTAPERAATRALALAFVSAAAAACHEAVWPRCLARWTGHGAWATGVALGVFVGGLGGGALLPALRPSLLTAARRRYQQAELAVALGALLALALFTKVAPPSVALGLRARVVDVLAGGVVLALPALAMGATFPLLVEQCRDAPRAASRLYLAGLAGACVGALGCAGVLVPLGGVVVAGSVAAGLNVLVALAAGALPDARSALVASSQGDAPWRRAAALFAAAGLFGTAAQAVWNRVLVPYAGVSPFAFAAIVAVYVGAQAAGMALAARVDASWRSVWLERVLAAAPAVALASLALCAAIARWPGARDGASWPWVFGTLAVAVVVAPTAALLGAGQLLALDAVDAQHHRGRAASLATGVGTLASGLGAPIASLALVPALGPRWTMVSLAAPLFAALAARGARGVGLAGVAAAAALAWAAPGPRYFLGREFDDAPVLYASFSAQDTTAVVRHDQPVEPAIRRLVSAGVSYSGDSLFAQRYMRLLAHLPALAAAQRTRALVLCVGTGTTLDALRRHPFARIDAVDLDPTIRETLRAFAHVHHGAPDDARVRLVVDDGDRWLTATPPHTYDVITLEPPPPRAPGGSTLYSVELYRRARAALRDGGVVAQWLPLHDLGAWEAASLTRTFLEVFPGASLHLAERNEAILLSDRAATSPRPDDALADELASIGLREVDPVAETLLADAAALREVTRDGALVTLAWPAPELAPLALPSAVDPLSTWAERVAAVATPASRDTWAARMGAALPSFLRVLEHGARPGDRERVAAAYAALARAHPDDPYLQYVRGYGSFLENRLQRLADEGVDPAVLEVTRARIAALRAHAEQR